MNISWLPCSTFSSAIIHLNTRMIQMLISQCDQHNRPESVNMRSALSVFTFYLFIIYSLLKTSNVTKTGSTWQQTLKNQTKITHLEDVSLSFWQPFCDQNQCKNCNVSIGKTTSLMITSQRLEGNTLWRVCRAPVSQLMDVAGNLNEACNSRVGARWQSQGCNCN